MGPHSRGAKARAVPYRFARREGAGPLIESGAITRGRKAVAYSGE